MFSVVVPATKYENKIDDNAAVYLHELDDKTIVQYFRKYPIPITDNFQFFNLLFNDKFLIDNKYYKTNMSYSLYKYP